MRKAAYIYAIPIAAIFILAVVRLRSPTLACTSISFESLATAWDTLSNHACATTWGAILCIALSFLCWLLYTRTDSAKTKLFQNDKMISNLEPFLLMLGALAFLLIAIWLLIDADKHDYTGRVIGVVGVVVTCVGFYATLYTLQLQESRIFGYPQFYNQVVRMMAEEDSKEHSTFLFAGPTIFPGNVAMLERASFVKDTIENGVYRQLLERLATKERSSESRIQIVVPDAMALKRAYDVYMYERFVSTEEASWKAAVRNSAERADELINALREHENSWNRLCELSSDKERELGGGYIVITSTRMIYAIPLHYQDAVSEDRRQPHLVGIETTDKATIDAFSQRFVRWSESSPPMLRFYKSHLIQPRLLRKLRDCYALLTDEAGLAKDEIQRKIGTLWHLDYEHDHFRGAAATSEYLTITPVNNKSNVLDLGSGLGGAARLFARETGCRVTAIELQEDRHRLAEELTAEAELLGQVTHVNADIQKYIADGKGFSHVVAILTLLHLPTREKQKAMYRRLPRMVTARGHVLVEDFVFNSDDRPPNLWRDWRRVYGSELVLSEAAIRSALIEGNADADSIKIEDLTPLWCEALRERASKLPESLKWLGRVEDRDAVRAAEIFYSAIAALFRYDIKYVRITATSK